MRISAVLAISLALSTPAFAQEVIVQTPNPAAAAGAAGAARQAGADAQFESNQARRDQGIANRDAAMGNYGAAAAAEGAAQGSRTDARIDSHIAHRDANVARQDDSYRVQVVP